MGCVCAKPPTVEEDTESRKEKVGNHSGTLGTVTHKFDISEAVSGFGEKERERVKARSKQNGTAGHIAVQLAERKRERHRVQTELNPRPSNPPKHIEGEQVAAGWPAWLTAQAGEAIKGWIPRRADTFEKLDKIGQGTYSNVYKARDLDTGKIVALKKVRFDTAEPESVRFMAREIQILRQLDHPNIVKLEGLVTSRMSCSLYLVFEYMEHDLAGLVACPGIKFTESQVKCYLHQLLRGLDHCHSHSVLHRDIKGSNLLLDNAGILKIADFGLATFFRPDQKQPLTSRVVTLWYRPPELLLGATEYGVAVDLWSTGCILAELLAGKPIMPGRTEVEQLHKIFKLCGSPSEEYWKKSKLPHSTIFKPQQPYRRCIAETYKDFPPSAVALLEIILAIEPAERGTVAAALKSQFFTTKPYACDPSSLPKYPPSKEFDAKMRDEEARRQRAAGIRARGPDAARRVGSREYASKAIPAPDANAESAASLQKRRINVHSVSESKSEKFNSRQDESAVGFRIDPPWHNEGSSGNHDPNVPPLAVGWSGPLPCKNFAGTWDKKQKSGETSTIPSRSLPRTAKFVTISELKAGDTEETHEDITAARQEDATQVDKTELLETLKQDGMEIHHSEKYFKGSDGLHLQDSVHHNRMLGAQVYVGQGDRIHFSGPLLPPTANLEDILGKHERQIQQAVRRAQQNKFKSQINGSSHKPWAIGDTFELRNSYVPTFSSNAPFKTAKAHFSGEIVELPDPREGLSSVMENHDEQET